MASYKWPGVYPSIRDLSGVVATNSGTSCGYVGEAEFGPINTPTLLSGLQNYTSIFGSLNTAKYGYAGYSLAVASESIDNHYFTRVVKAGPNAETGEHEDDDAMLASVKVPAKNNPATQGYGWYVEEADQAFKLDNSDIFFNSSTYEIANVQLVEKGAHYNVGDTLLIDLDKEDGELTVTGLTPRYYVNSVALDASTTPSGYVDGDIVELQLDRTNATFSLTVSEDIITEITIVNAGESTENITGSVQLTGGTGTGLSVSISMVNFGEIASVSLVNTGESTASSVENPVSTTTTGTGSGATFAITLDNRDLSNAFIVIANNPNNLKYQVRVSDSTVNVNRAYAFDGITYTQNPDDASLYTARVSGVYKEVYDNLNIGEEFEITRTSAVNGIYTATNKGVTEETVGTETIYHYWVEFEVTSAYEPTPVTEGKISNYPEPNQRTFRLDILQTIGRATTVIETYDYCTLYPAKDNYGNSMYVEDVVNGTSNAVKVYVNSNMLDELEDGEVLEPNLTVSNLPLAGGQSGGKPTLNDLVSAWSLFNDRSQTYVTLLLNSGYTNTAYQNAMLATAEKRRDCFCLFDIPLTETEYDNAIDWRKNTLGMNTYRGALSSPWVKTYDSVQGRANFMMCPSAFIAKLIGAAGDPWNAPAGPNRGIIGSATVSPTGLTQTYDDVQGGILYTDNQINCIIRDASAGYVNWGQRTLQQKPSALDRINVSRTIIYIETVLRDAARWHLFENNTPYERMQITLQFSSFLDTILSAGGIAAYQVICDDSNNTPIVIQNNQLVIDIIIRPVYTAEVIILNTTVIGEDASVSVTSSAN